MNDEERSARFVWKDGDVTVTPPKNNGGGTATQPKKTKKLKIKGSDPAILGTEIAAPVPAPQEIMRINATILGAAGELYAMYQMLRRNMIAALAPAGVPDADIIVSDRIGSKLFAVQVKTRSHKGADGGWHMRAKHETISRDSLFYCFISFKANLNDSPDCWVIPSTVVANVLTESHASWLKRPGRNGVAPNDHDMRRFIPDGVNLNVRDYPQGWCDQYRENWLQISK